MPALQATTANLMSYDNYSDTNDLGSMVSDQLAQLRNGLNHADNLFLLSWTLTQATFSSIITTVVPTLPGASAADSILDLAAQADATLWKDVSAAYEGGTNPIPKSTIPNFVYVDNFGTFATDTAMWLNRNLNPQCRSGIGRHPGPSGGSTGESFWVV